MTAMMLAVMAASLLGSFHCAGMCGPLALLAASGPMTARQAARMTSAYHGGRLVGYSLVGGLAGMLGAALDLGGYWLGLQQTAAVVAGAFMMLLGAFSLPVIRGAKPFHMQPPVFIDRLLRAGHRRATHLSPLSRALTIGLLTVFLPCGWLYAFLITAAGTASPLWGMGVMAVFWAGTVPVLVFLTFGLRRITGRWRNHLPWASALLMILVGAYTMTARSSVQYESWVRSQNATSVTDELARVESLPTERMPCCHAK